VRGYGPSPWRLRRTALLLAIAAVGASACAGLDSNVARAKPHRIDLLGCSVLPPAGEDWEVQRGGPTHPNGSSGGSPANVTFLKDDGRMAAGATVYVVDWKLPNNLEMARHAVNVYGKPMGDWGGRIVSFDTWPDMISPRECVRYETRLERPVDSPSIYDWLTGRTTLFTAINGRLCSNPDSAEHLVDVRDVMRYTRRRFFPTPTSEVLEPIQREGEPFVESLKFGPLPPTRTGTAADAIQPG
jgi:hypothetical protein